MLNLSPPPQFSDLTIEIPCFNEKKLIGQKKWEKTGRKLKDDGSTWKRVSDSSGSEDFLTRAVIQGPAIGHSQHQWGTSFSDKNQRFIPWNTRLERWTIPNGDELSHVSWVKHIKTDWLTVFQSNLQGGN